MTKKAKLKICILGINKKFKPKEARERETVEQQ